MILLLLSLPLTLTTFYIHNIKYIYSSSLAMSITFSGDFEGDFDFEILGILFMFLSTLGILVTVDVVTFLSPSSGGEECLALPAVPELPS